MRTLFNQPIRKDTTEHIYPDKIGFDEFINDLESIKNPFEIAVRNLDVGNDSKYIEEWYELLMSWNEVETE